MNFAELEKKVGKNSAAQALDELVRIDLKGLDEYDYNPILAMDKTNSNYVRKVYVIGRWIPGTKKSDFAVIPASKMFSVFEQECCL